jgi:hypothetical protein
MSFRISHELAAWHISLRGMECVTKILPLYLRASMQRLENVFNKRISYFKTCVQARRNLWELISLLCILLHKEKRLAL